MKIAFFGSYGSFDYNHIGGTNSFIRRLSLELIERGDYKIDNIFYGTDKNDIKHNKYWHSKYFKGMDDSLEVLKEYDHIITVYVPKKDIIKYRYFCIKNANDIIINMMYWVWPESYVKRNIMFKLYRNLKYNGTSIAISPRIKNAIKSWDRNCMLILPPVPRDFFLTLKEKREKEKITVTYIGRLDEGKGIVETLELFKSIYKYIDIELIICATYWEKNDKAKKMHNFLQKQKMYDYIYINHKEYSKQTDLLVKSLLQDTDIFIQPYKKMSSSIDTPLLLLEAMASLCAVISTPIGDVSIIYPSSKCIMKSKLLVTRGKKLILSAKDWIQEERNKIYAQNAKLKFDIDSVTDNFINVFYKKRN